jgi:PEP-CTERM motif
MKSLHPFLSIAVAAAITLAFGPAQAASSASAQFKGLTATLTDTNLHDGITPSLVFTSEFDGGDQSRSHVSAGVFQDFTTYGFNEQYGSSPFSSISTSTQYGSSTAGASVTAVGSAMNLSAHGSALGGPASEYFANASLQSPTDAQIFFRLSGHTSVTFSGVASVSTSLTSHDDSGTSAEVFLQSFGGVSFNNVARTGGASPTNDTASLSLNAIFPDQPLHQSATQRLSVTVTNTGSSPFIGEFEAYASVQGGASISPVPEPGTYAMMLAGLALVGYVARRRRG